MKAYTFIHKSIYGPQVGIQAGHSLVALAMENGNRGPLYDLTKEEKILLDWYENHKTFVWLDGGNSSSMHEAIKVIADSDMPYSAFTEPDITSVDSTEGVLTAITVVLTKELVEYADKLRADPEYYNPHYELNVQKLVSLVSCSRTKGV